MDSGNLSDVWLFGFGQGIFMLIPILQNIEAIGFLNSL